MLILYVNYWIIISKTKEGTDNIFADLTNKGFNMIYERAMEDYLGILITYDEDGLFRISYPHLIDRIIESIPGMKDVRSATTPASVAVILTNDKTGDLHKEHWNDRSVIGMSNYLVNCTHLGSVIIQSTVMNKQ